MVDECLKLGATDIACQGTRLDMARLLFSVGYDIEEFLRYKLSLYNLNKGPTRKLKQEIIDIATLPKDSFGLGVLEL